MNESLSTSEKEGEVRERTFSLRDTSLEIDLLDLQA